MDISSIGTAVSGAWYGAASQASVSVVREPPAEATTATDAYGPQTSAEPVGDIYDWQGTLVDTFA